ncbi:UNVERIFIED_CONTAM: hypothetical protein Sradi_6916200 [Sesamum radiatum]|uniref:Aminotransferase-like plant mobile domain-containing protein n=1 Tax=Sesamum radiatum TaxID=300843 RepID=A0AAW2JHP0_SESRA
MNGLLYDEVVPCAKELDGVDETGRRATKYYKPPPRKEKKAVRPKSTHNPSGTFGAHGKWSSAEEALFSKLGMEGSLEQETFLAAYLACWLCTSVLPTNGVGLIRPSSFKVASIMAAGISVGLVPVLASIYKGLKILSRLPGILSQDIRRASLDDGIRYWRLCISSKTMKKVWFPSMPPNAKKFSSEEYKGWWTKTHGDFLEENVVSSKDVEVLETSKKKSVSRPLEKNESSNLDRHWKRLKRDFGISKSMNVDGDVSSHAPSMLNFAKELEDEVLDVEGDETSQDSQESTLGSNLLAITPIGMGLKKRSPHHAAVSAFEGERFVLNHQGEFFQKMRSDLLLKISKTPVDFISSIKDDVRFVLESMKTFQHFDISKMEELLNAFFAKATAYDEARSSSSEKLSKVLLERQLKEANTRLQEVSKIQSTMDELEHIEKKLVDLKKQKVTLCATLKGQKQFLHSAQVKVHEIEVEIATFKNTIPLDDEAVKNLESSRANLEVLREELENLCPFA